MNKFLFPAAISLLTALSVSAQTTPAMPMPTAPVASESPTNPLWHEIKTKNYLPDMTWPEVEDLLTRSDMVIIPVGSLEEHGYQLPIGTDILNGLERAKLVAQKTDVLVAPILMPGNSPYHMAFPGTISLKAETIQLVYFEACQSLMQHGFKRFLLLNSHGGNAAITRYIVDRINQETEGIAVELGEAAAIYEPRSPRPAPAPGAPAPIFDRHAGVGETSSSLYLIPSLVNMSVARTTPGLTMPMHMNAMLPLVAAGDPAASLVFLAEGLKAKSTGKRTSTREMTSVGIWGLRNINDSTVEQGKKETDSFVAAAVKFIERWKQLRPLHAN